MDLDLEIKPKKLCRSQTDKMIFGVCGGIGEYYNVESTWVRLVLVFLVFITSGFALLLYFIMALLMPANRDQGLTPKENLEDLSVEMKNLGQTAKQAMKSGRSGRRRSVLGVAIIIIGLIAFFNELFPNFWIGWKVLWPIIIILIGVSFISDSRAGH